MAHRIFKYTLAVTDEQHVTLPYGYKILSVTNQKNVLHQTEDIVLYALVDADEKIHMVAPTIHVYGTGYPMDEEALAEGRLSFIGTVALHNGALMFHVFERLNDPAYSPLYDRKEARVAVNPPKPKYKHIPASTILFEYRFTVRAGEVRQLLAEEGIDPSSENVTRYIDALADAHHKATDVEAITSKALAALAKQIGKRN